jgi:hypothetical protein
LYALNKQDQEIILKHFDYNSEKLNLFIKENEVEFDHQSKKEFYDLLFKKIKNLYSSQIELKEELQNLKNTIDDLNTFPKIMEKYFKKELPHFYKFIFWSHKTDQFEMKLKIIPDIIKKKTFIKVADTFEEAFEILKNSDYTTMNIGLLKKKLKNIIKMNLISEFKEWLFTNKETDIAISINKKLIKIFDN